MDIIRAGVFIGVDKTGKLKKLNDAAKGARRMYRWALRQGISKHNAKLITDERGKKVSLERIYTAIKQIVDGAGVDQLIIYFAGHGVYNNYSERWLLSDAPEMTSAAINVHGSVELARYCGIKHVVFISDACRMAPAGIQASNVSGSEIFPNDPIIEGKVDQFFACSRGKAAFEYKDDSDAANTYTALFTTTLLDALNGKHPEVLEYDKKVGGFCYYLKPPGLDKYLRSELPRRVKLLKLENKVSQNPDAIVVVGGGWIAQFDPTEIDVSIVHTPTYETSLKPVYSTVIKISRELAEILRQMEITGFGFFNESISIPKDEFYRLDSLLEINKVNRTIAMLTVPFGPDHFETECGFKVRGARIAEFFALGVSGELLGENGDILRIDTNGAKEGAINVLLHFEGNFGTVIPAVPGYIAALTFDEGELISVAYEPSANTILWEDFEISAVKIRALRAIAASSSNYSRFSLNQENVSQIATMMHEKKEYDLSLSVYAAYAYYDLQEIDRIRSMTAFQSYNLNLAFFDLALLGRFLTDKYIDSVAPTLVLNTGVVFPFIPLLSQGWSLLKANKIKLHPAIIDLEDHLRDSLWSLYDSAGIEKLKQAMQFPHQT